MFGHGPSVLIAAKHSNEMHDKREFELPIGLLLSLKVKPETQPIILRGLILCLSNTIVVP